MNREKIIVRASWVSVLGNALLALLKIVVGLMAGSLAVLGDGVDSATDVVISLITLYAARVASRPPTPKYAYGYERAEGIATKILSLIIFAAGIQMLVISLRHILSGVEREMPMTIAIWVTALSMVGKVVLAWYQHAQGKRTGSRMLIANAKNMRNDVLTSAGVLLGLFFTFVLRLPVLDAVTSLIISLFILRTAYGIFKETSVVLMDGVEDEGVYRHIFDAVAQTDGASRPHRVRVRQIGDRYQIDMDIEADGSLPLVEAHAIAQQVEGHIRRRLKVYDIVIHVEPLGMHHQHDREKFGVTPEILEKDEKTPLE